MSLVLLVVFSHRWVRSSAIYFFVSKIGGNRAKGPPSGIAIGRSCAFVKPGRGRLRSRRYFSQEITRLKGNMSFKSRVRRLESPGRLKSVHGST